MLIFSIIMLVIVLFIVLYLFYTMGQTYNFFQKEEDNIVDTFVISLILLQLSCACLAVLITNIIKLI